jgi:hypothetical protein
MDQLDSSSVRNCLDHVIGFRIPFSSPVFLPENARRLVPDTRDTPQGNCLPDRHPCAGRPPLDPHSQLLRHLHDPLLRHLAHRGHIRGEE